MREEHHILVFEINTFTFTFSPVHLTSLHQEAQFCLLLLNINTKIQFKTTSIRIMKEKIRNKMSLYKRGTMETIEMSTQFSG